MSRSCTEDVAATEIGFELTKSAAKHVRTYRQIDVVIRSLPDIAEHDLYDGHIRKILVNVLSSCMGDVGQTEITSERDKNVDIRVKVGKYVVLYVLT